MGKVVVGPVNVQSFALVTKIFFGQCISVVFTVPGREEVAALHIGQQADTGNITVCQDLQVLYLGNVLPQNFRMPGVGNVKHIVQSPHQWMGHI